MRIISHRGWWLHPEEKNQIIAFERSFSNGFGTETDVRDLDGRLVISHDMPTSKCSLPIEQVLEMAEHYGVPLALNIKADGLAQLLNATTRRYPRLEWFVFDMSVPDMRSHLSTGNPTYTRYSDIEPHPAYLNRAAGVWLDELDTQWVTQAVTANVLQWGKPVCVVSPELHGRDPQPLWSQLESLKSVPNLTLCTDLPDLAKQRILGAK